METIKKKINNKKILFVFDFDHTILKANSDYEILNLLSDNSLKYLEPLNEKSTNWANHMQEVYKRMKKENVKIDQVQKIVEELSFNEGYDELFKLIRENKDKIDTLIVSGANTLFLKWVLEKRGLSDIFPEYYSNWAEPDEDLVIKIRPHHNHECENCDKSQCKKLILKTHFEKMKSADEMLVTDLNDDFIYRNILYAGDGTNDYCPSTILREEDILFPRSNFPLAKKLLKQEHAEKLKCKVHLWQDAYKIIEELNKLL